MANRTSWELPCSSLPNGIGKEIPKRHLAWRSSFSWTHHCHVTGVHGILGANGSDSLAFWWNCGTELWPWCLWDIDASQKAYSCILSSYLQWVGLYHYCYEYFEFLLVTFLALLGVLVSISSPPFFLHSPLLSSGSAWQWRPAWVPADISSAMSSAEDVWTPIRGSESPPHLTWKHAVADALKKTHCVPWFYFNKGFDLARNMIFYLFRCHWSDVFSANL